MGGMGGQKECPVCGNIVGSVVTEVIPVARLISKG